MNLDDWFFRRDGWTLVAVTLMVTTLFAWMVWIAGGC